MPFCLFIAWRENQKTKLPDTYEVGFIYLKSDGESHHVIYTIQADSKAYALRKARVRFDIDQPTSQISLSHTVKIFTQYYAVTIWFDDAEGKGKVWFRFIEDTSELNALMKAKRLFLKTHDFQQISLVKEQVFAFPN